MADVTTTADLHQLELLLEAGDPTGALSLVTQRLQQDPDNRQLQLFSLLTRIVAFGPEPVESEIDGLRALTNLTESERAIIGQILRRGLEAAVSSGDAGKIWVYRRSLRRLHAGLSLDRPFSPLRLDRHPPAAKLSEKDVATVRNVFLAAPDNRRMPAHRDTPYLMTTLKKTEQGLAVLRSKSGTVAQRVRVSGCELGRACRKQMVALLDGRGVRALTSPGAVSSVISLIVVITGWHLIGARFSHAPSADPVVEEKIQVPAAQQRAAADANPPGSVTANDAPVPATPSADPAKPSNSIAKDSVAGMRGTARKNPQPAMEPAHVFHAVQTVGLRGEPRYGAAKEDSLASGARVVVIESRGSWVKVRSEANGSIGYVRKEFLALRSPPRRNTVDSQAKR